MKQQIDLFDFIRNNTEQADVLAEDSLGRVLEVALAVVKPGLSSRLTGTFRRRSDGSEEFRLAARVAGRLSVQCVRCLQPVDVDVSVDQAYLVVADEKQAEQLDFASSDVDVIAGSETFAILDLIEDELLLAMPTEASHETCAIVAAPAQAPLDKPNPFAVLAKLKVVSSDQAANDGAAN